MKICQPSGIANCKPRTGCYDVGNLEVKVEFHMVHVPDLRDPLPEAHSYTPHMAANNTEAKKKKSTCCVLEPE